MSQSKNGLGRGLSSLFGENASTSTSGNNAGVRKIDVKKIRPCPFQPRRQFNQEDLDTLAESIRKNGLLQPIVVRKCPEISDKDYEIIAGERRWRAAQQAGIYFIPALVKENVTDREVFELAIIENLQREDLSAIEEAEAYLFLKDQHNHTQQEIAEIVGKSRSHVANTLRLLSLPSEIKQYINEKKISAGHARALISSDNPTALAEEIILNNLSVRDIEEKLKKKSAKTSKNSQKSSKNERNFEPDDADVIAIQEHLGSILNAKVQIITVAHKPTVSLEFESFEALDTYIESLSVMQKIPEFS